MLIWWVFRNDSIFSHVARYLASWWAKNGSYLRFPDINWKGFHSIHFKPRQCAYWVSVQNFWPRGQIFGSLLSDNQINKALSLKTDVCYWFWCSQWGLCHHWCLVFPFSTSVLEYFHQHYWNSAFYTENFVLQSSIDIVVTLSNYY